MVIVYLRLIDVQKILNNSPCASVWIFFRIYLLQLLLSAVDLLQLYLLLLLLLLLLLCRLCIGVQ